ncbi:SdpI/YhfL protein family protein [Bacillus sp. 5mfcol3.1]|uniref:SdpI family protein n=1 Tax=unclassified Bacillus (in: firmicutes) TaxID=185979 RepID=UPI00047A46A8|nr:MULTISPECIES: SdpI family protein [unclassified Bacillus (in: firmicutes)]SFM34480.1 SdpI/YhfL protein family protein [Bacillus sp. 5mfcol3.1]
MLLLIISLVTFIIVFVSMEILGNDSNPNKIIGYRTKRSMKNKENWIMAQKYFKFLFIRSYLIIVIFSLFLSIYEHFIGINFITLKMYNTIQVFIAIFPLFVYLMQSSS